MRVTPGTITGSPDMPGCVGATTCAAQWTGPYDLTFVTGSDPCTWALTDTPKLLCLGSGSGFDIVLYSCIDTVRSFRLTIQQDTGGNWIQRLVISIRGGPSTFNPWVTTGRQTLVYEYSGYVSQPSCGAIDLDQSLPLISSVPPSYCCSFTIGTTSIP